MSDHDVDEPLDSVVHTARISWLTDPPHGHAIVSVGSRAIAAVPTAGDDAADERRVTSPGELMAAAHGSAVAAILAQVLVRDGTPARELVVATTYAFAGEWLEPTDLELYVEGRVPGIEAARFERSALEAVDRFTESFGAPAHPKLRLTTRLL